MSDSKKLKFDSKLIHSGAFDEPYGSATVPIYQTSTFKFKSAEHGAACFAGESDGYIYTRIGNPTIKALEDLVADLENGFGGIATSSGMGAVNTVYGTFLEKGSHVICSSAVYGPSRVVLETYYAKYGVESTFVNTANINEVEAAIKPNTKLLYVETPANPTMEVSDLKACSQLAKKHNIILAVDNTFCSPYLQNPLDLGADVVLHSITKFLNGHADIVGGIVIAKEKSLYTKLRGTMVNMGFNMDPHQAYMVIRGIKTLSIRIEQAQKSAIKIAEFLENHPKVEWVKYPGLKSHPQYELVKKQMRGPGTMMSFGLKGGIEAGRKMMNAVQLAILAVSLGGVETLIQHPASMTHSKMSKEGRLSAGITDGLVRFSVGIEDYEDILADLVQALDKA
ncbi:MAG: trans-sulfuration enzyme family protein [Bacteroidales bacterium]|jgi:methionine-gamma-lyase